MLKRKNIVSLALALSLGKSCILSKSKVLQIEQFYNVKKGKSDGIFFCDYGNWVT